MIKQLLLIAILYFCIVSYPTMGSVFYVDPSIGGTNTNSGLFGDPWATIQQATSTAQAGDTVFVKEGDYAEKVTFAHSGKSDSLITFIGLGKVTIQEPFNTTIWSGTLNLNARKYIRIQNFSIQNAYWFGIYVEACDHIYLENNKTYNTGASGISVWHSSHIYAGYNTVQKACYQSLSTGSQECITFSGVSNFEIHHNEIFESGGSNNGGEGIDAKEACSFGKIYNNLVHDLIRLGIYTDSWDKNLHDIDIFNNRVFNCSDGIVVSSENGGIASNINIYNNLTYNNDNFGIVISEYDLDGPRNNIRVMNNTVYANGFGDSNTAWGGGIIVSSKNVSSIFIFNNIVSENDAMQISDNSGVSTVLISTNLIYGYKGLNWTSEVKGIDAIESDPLFIDVAGADKNSNTADDNFNVSLSSPAINAGTNNDAPIFDFNDNKRPAEGIVDIGAYESNSVSVSTIKNNQTTSKEALFLIYPNPNSGKFTVRCEKVFDYLEVFDQNGNLIQHHAMCNLELMYITIEYPGCYVLLGVSGSARQTNRIVVY